MNKQSVVFEAKYKVFAEKAVELMNLTNVEYNGDFDASVGEAVMRTELHIQNALTTLSKYEEDESISTKKKIDLIGGATALLETLIELYDSVSEILEMAYDKAQIADMMLTGGLDTSYHRQSLDYLNNLLFEICSEVS